jgi:filamentous hemagglutinin family protein
MENNSFSSAYKRGLDFVIGVTIVTTTWVSHSLAQVTPPITSSGLNTQINVSSNPPAGKVQYDITGGTRPGGGTNLFHSFGDFNVPSSNIANFLNDSGLATSNILGRVTGGNISNIFGMIQTNGPGGFGSANLFLINPAGFLFGPNATLNVGGMVAFTSADYLRLTDGKLFNAAPNSTADAVLSTAPVAAYGFLGLNPGAITVQGSQLAVSAGHSLSLVGGNITIQSGTMANGTIQSAELSAPGGQINLASVASSGEILAGNLAHAPNVNGQSFATFGAVQISEQSTIDVSGNGGGTVLIRGGNFVIDNSTISANATGPGPITNGGESVGGGIDIQVSQNAIFQNGEIVETNVVGNVTPGVTYGGVQVKADHIEITGVPPVPPFPFTGIRSNVGTDTQPTINGGNSGNIILDANSILIKGGGTLETRVFGLDPLTPVPGNAGNITVTARHDLQLNESAIESSILFGSGTAGDIALTSTNGSILETGIALPPNFVPVPGEPFPSTAFNIIFNQVGGGPGNTGNITLNAPQGEIRLAGAVIVIGEAGTGVPGTFKANAQNMQLTNFSTIQMDNFSPEPAPSFNLAINGNLAVDSSRIITTARGPAQAADLNITAHDVLVTGISSLSTETRSVGNAGHLTISAETLEVTNGGKITSGTAQNPPIPPFPGGPPVPIIFPPPTGEGGTITVQGLAGSGSRVNSVLINGAGSGIFTNTVGTGPAGNTNISTLSLNIQNGGTISAATSGTVSNATGGSITVNAEHIAANTQGLITAETNGIAPAGVVDINTSTLAINSGGQIRSSSGAETEQVSALALLSTPATLLTGGTIFIQGQNGNGSQANTVTIDGSGSGIFTQSTGNRPGGDINVLTSQSVAMTNGASVSASSTGTGNAGNININAGNQFAMRNSTVTTEANQASGGAIKITTTPSGMVELTNSAISASVLDGTGGGGSVDIDPQFVILQNSQILANSIFGPGGNIFITTNLLLPDTTSVISASSQFGQQGSIVIQSPVSPASGKINPIGQRPLIPTSMVSQRCAALAGGNVSSFTVAGRDSVPSEPGSWLSSPLALVDRDEKPSLSGLSGLSGSVRTEIYSHQIDQIDRIDQIDQTNEIPLLSLRQIAPPGFLIQSFAPNGSTGC